MKFDADGCTAIALCSRTRCASALGRFHDRADTGMGLPRYTCRHSLLPPAPCAEQEKISLAAASAAQRVLPVVPFVSAGHQPGRRGLHGPSELWMLMQHVHNSTGRQGLHVRPRHRILGHWRHVFVPDVPCWPDLAGWPRPVPLAGL